MCEQKWLPVTPRNAHYLARQERLESNVGSYPRKFASAWGLGEGCGKWFRQQLVLLFAQYPALAQVRGQGLMLGIDAVDERGTVDHLGSYPGDASLTSAIQHHCFRQGLLLERGERRSGNVVRFLPPLIISGEECQVAVERFLSAVECACAEYRQ